jgi:hypothetical protein
VPSLRYKNHYISVLHLPDKSGKSSCTVCVEIRPKRDHVLSTRLTINQSFSTAQDATAEGLATGKRWIDQHAAQRDSASVTAGEPQRVRSRFRSWLASLL